MNIPSSTMKKEAISHVFPREITRAWNGSPPLTCSCRKKKNTMFWWRQPNIQRKEPVPIKENQFLVDLDLFYVMNGNVCLLAVQLLIKHSQQNNGLNYDLSLSLIFSSPVRLGYWLVREKFNQSWNWCSQLEQFLPIPGFVPVDWIVIYIASCWFYN